MPETGERRARATRWSVAVLALGAVLALAAGAGLEAFPFQMPDPRQMSGIPLPSGDLPDGAVSVRVIRGQLSNNVVDQPVDLMGGETTSTVSTDASGRALFGGLGVGAIVRAVTVLDGRRIESQPFAIPARGGIRLMLVGSEAGAAGGGPPARGAAPRSGSGPDDLAFGGESRIILELGEENLEVYYLLDLMNPAASAVTPPAPLTLDLPAAATAATLLEGSTPGARLGGRHLEMAGPFQPGATHVQVAYFLPYGSGEVSMSQQLPAPLSEVAVLAQRFQGVELGSPQIQNRRNVTAQGLDYIVAAGPGLPAGAPLTLRLTGLPHHATLPATLAIVVALGIMGVGFWSALAPGDPALAARRTKLEARREMLFTTLVRIAETHRAGGMDDAGYATRRRDLIRQLERVYRSLDTAGSRAA